jgi:hypothetical protein
MPNAVVQYSNYVQIGGQLFVKDPQRTPFLSSIGLTEGGKDPRFEEGFAVPGEIYAGKQTGWKTYDPRNPASSKSKEYADAPTPNFENESQLNNTFQIFDKYTFGVSWYQSSTAGDKKDASGGSETIIQTTQLSDRDLAIMSKQGERQLKDLKSDLEYTYLYETQVTPANPATTAPGMAGITTVASGVTEDLSGAAVSETKLESWTMTLANKFAFAESEGLILMSSPYVINEIGKIYGKAPESRTVAGLAIQEILIAGYKYFLVANPNLVTYGKGGDIIIYNPSVMLPMALRNYNKETGKWEVLMLVTVPTEKSGDIMRYYGVYTIEYGNPDHIGYIQNAKSSA